jgi:hypothetical protein
MSQVRLWLRRKDLADDIDWLFNEARPREWHAQPFSSWRRLLLLLRGWDAANAVSRGSTWPGHEL